MIQSASRSKPAVSPALAAGTRAGCSPDAASIIAATRLDAKRRASPTNDVVTRGFTSRTRSSRPSARSPRIRSTPSPEREGRGPSRQLAVGKQVAAEVAGRGAVTEPLPHRGQGGRGPGAADQRDADRHAGGQRFESGRSGGRPHPGPVDDLESLATAAAAGLADGGQAEAGRDRLAHAQAAACRHWHAPGRKCVERSLLVGRGSDHRVGGREHSASGGPHRPYAVRQDPVAFGGHDQRPVGLGGRRHERGTVAARRHGEPSRPRRQVDRPRLVGEDGHIQPGLLRRVGGQCREHHPPFTGDRRVVSDEPAGGAPFIEQHPHGRESARRGWRWLPCGSSWVTQARGCPCHLAGRSLRPSRPPFARCCPRFGILPALGQQRRSIGMGSPEQSNG